MWPYPLTQLGTSSQRNTWTGWRRHCSPKHLRERLKRHLNSGSWRDMTSPW